MTSKVPKNELQETLQGLRNVLEANEQEYRAKKGQFDDLAKELNGLQSSIASLKGSIMIVERALGLAPTQEQPAEPAPAKIGGGGEVVDTSKTVMGIVASRNESGGMTFDELFDVVKEKNLNVTREYLHTILNRKKNHQKKLAKVEGRWFLTDKGKEELGMK